MRKIGSKQQKSSDTNVQYIKIFFVVLIVVIFVSSVVRFISYAKESRYNGKHFVMLIKNKQWFLVHVSGTSKELSMIEFTNTEKMKKWSKEKLSIYLGVPIDGVLEYKKPTQDANFRTSFFSFSNIFSIVTSPRYKFSGFNRIDLWSMYLQMREDKEPEYQFLTMKENDFTQLDTMLYDSFSDDVIKEEKVSVEIINASDINGVGTKLARMMKNAGYNVVSITSSDLSISKIIYRIPKNYTIEKVLTFFPLRSEYNPETHIADVSIIVGEDFAQKFIVDAK